MCICVYVHTLTHAPHTHTHTQHTHTPHTHHTHNTHNTHTHHTHHTHTAGELIAALECALWHSSRQASASDQWSQVGRGVYTGMYVCIYVCMYVLVYSYTLILLYSYTLILIYSYTHINIYTYTHINIYTYTHILIYTYTHRRQTSQEPPIRHTIGRSICPKAGVVWGVQGNAIGACVYFRSHGVFVLEQRGAAGTYYVCIIYYVCTMRYIICYLLLFSS
jgi:hypothetical protein